MLAINRKTIFIITAQVVVVNGMRTLERHRKSADRLPWRKRTEAWFDPFQNRIDGTAIGGVTGKLPWKERAIAAWPPPEPDEGEKIEGKIIRVEPNVNATETNKLFDYVLDVDNTETRVWGSKLLNLQLTDKDIGKNVRIEYEGLGKVRKKGQNAPKMFKVQVEEKE
jgi:hypothetical protein